MENILITCILVALAVSIIRYLVRAKKRGEKCVGCPYGKQYCGKSRGSCSGNVTNK